MKTFHFEDGSALLPVRGFVPFTPFVLSPGGNCLVIPEQNPAGDTAHVSIVSIDPGSGQPLEETFTLRVPGFQEGVAPVFYGDNVLVPCRNIAGTRSRMVVLKFSNPEDVTYDALDLDDLSFVKRGQTEGLNGDGIFILESADGETNGFLWYTGGREHVDRFVLFSTDGRNVGDVSVAVPWLTRPPDLVSPLSFHDSENRLGLAWPTIGPDGGDITLITISRVGARYSPSTASLTGLNGGRGHPLDIAGFVPEMDFLDTPRGLVIPFMAKDGHGEVCLFDKDGKIVWRLGEEAEREDLEIPGFVPGSDFSFVDGNLLVPIQDAKGRSDLWIVDLVTGRILYRASDQNRGLGLPSQIAGVGPGDAARSLDPDELLLPVLDRKEGPGLLLFRDDLTLDASFFDRSLLGFKPWVRPEGGYVPVVAGDSVADVVYFTGPHLTGAYSLGENDEVTLHDFVRDVGPRVVKGGYVFLAEQDTGGAFLRMEQVPGTQGTVVVVDAGKAGEPGALYFFDEQSHALILKRDGVSRPVTGIPMIATPVRS